MFQKDKKLTLLTAYDFLTAQILEKAKIDAILVGDSLGMTFAGETNTHKVTIEQMCYHIKVVKRGAPNTTIIGDMPINTYTNEKEALKNAQKLITNGADLVKIEGGQEIEKQIKILIQNKVQVIGHLGLTPQTAENFKVVGKERSKAKKLVEDAKLLTKIGVTAIVLECVPAELAQRITKIIKTPTIGIGAGKHCNGQILVFQDLVGLTNSDFRPKFLKRYLQANRLMLETVKIFQHEVRNGIFPDKKHSY